VIVDTGSGVTAFPCSKCNDCGAPKYHIDNYFMEADSSTFNHVGCKEGQQCTGRGRCNGGESGECIISMSYQEGSSWTAYEAVDKCYVGGPHEFPLTKDSGEEDIDPGHASHFAYDMIFGCQTHLTGLFKTQLADGIMGMDQGNLSYWNQMFASGKMGDAKQFSLCFSRPPTADRKGTEAGAMTLGGADPRLHESDMVWSSNSGSSGFFQAPIRAVYLRHGSGGESAKSADPNAEVIKLAISESDLNKGSVIVDSGTTDTYWNRNLATTLKPAFLALAGKAYDNKPVSLTAAQLNALPTILFQIKGSEGSNAALNADPNQVTGLAGNLDPDNPHDVILAFPPSHYMEFDKNSRKYVSRFYVTEGGGSVLGANAMMGHDILFDADNSQIGWAESDCDYTKLITENGYPSVFSLQQQEGGSGETTETKAQPETKTGVQSETEKEEEPQTEEDGKIDGTNEEGETAEKKKEPSGSDTHAQHNPDNDIKKAGSSSGPSGVMTCDSFVCGGGAMVGIILALVMGICLGRRYCSPRRAAQPNYQKAPETEMTDASFSTYKDEPEDDDAEFGEYNGNGVVS
jgi:hypothetical protein